MAREGLANGKKHVDEEDKDGALDKQPNVGFGLGDVMWTKFRGSLWWPVQIVDENAVSDSVKPRKGRSGEVLVRLYGTYKYSYVDPLTSAVEFNSVLKRCKGSHKEIIQKALKQDLNELQYGRNNTRSTKNKDFNPCQTKARKGSVVKENARLAKRALEELDENVTPEKFKGSARRLKVMQDLGLIAPSGSPFLKNGQILSVVQ